MRHYFEDGNRISYGARALNEGGIQVSTAGMHIDSKFDVFENYIISLFQSWLCLEQRYSGVLLVFSMFLK